MGPENDSIWNSTAFGFAACVRGTPTPVRVRFKASMTVVFSRVPEEKEEAEEEAEEPCRNIVNSFNQHNPCIHSRSLTIPTLY